MARDAGTHNQPTPGATSLELLAGKAAAPLIRTKTPLPLEREPLEPTIQALKVVIHQDSNVICVGYAMDALSRLANLGAEQTAVSPAIRQLQTDLLAILGECPLQSSDALVRAGLSLQSLSRFGQLG